jgi:hypothetical protein
MTTVCTFRLRPVPEPRWGGPPNRKPGSGTRRPAAPASLDGRTRRGGRQGPPAGRLCRAGSSAWRRAGAARKSRSGRGQARKRPVCQTHRTGRRKVAFWKFCVMVRSSGFPCLQLFSIRSRDPHAGRSAGSPGKDVLLVRGASGGSISGRLPHAGFRGDKESLWVYREQEAHLEARSPCCCDLQRSFDGGGGDLHPARNGALTHLDAHAYHPGHSFLSLLLSVHRAWSCARCRRLLPSNVPGERMERHHPKDGA